MKTKICKQCQQEFEITRSNRKNVFCSRNCSAKFNNIGPHSEETRKKLSDSLKKYYLEHPEAIRNGDEQSKAVGKGTKGKSNKTPKSIMELSSRTVTKILKRLNIACSRCGWKESTCDIHHINGKKIPDCNNHTNLTLLCPNCHRLVHTHKVETKELIPLSSQLKEDWLDLYYG